MKALIQIEGQTYSVDFDRAYDISIPLHFDGEQPNTYNVPKARARAYEDEHFVGDTRRGGSCNFLEHTLIPHCNGTHTECVGHISLERISIHRILPKSLIPCTLISVETVPAADSGETYDPEKSADDQLITLESLRQALNESAEAFTDGVIVRTLPNDSDKLSRNYLASPPPYFSIEAMQFIVDAGVRHLLVDTPSVDRLFDEGKLTNHHMFWNVAQGSHDVKPDSCSHNTITEMIFVANSMPDGRYLLNLQAPTFIADAAPSRPLIYPVSQEAESEER